MRPISGNHIYELDHFESPNDPYFKQHLVFINKTGDPLVTVHDGTTNEEVLRVLIHRVTALDLLLPCYENKVALNKLEDALKWLEKRSQDRADRNIEGTGSP